MEQHQFGTLDKAEVKDIEQGVKGYLSSRDTGSNLNHYSADELAMLATAKRLVRNFMQSGKGYYQAYQNQSGEIFGILTQLGGARGGPVGHAEEGGAGGGAAR